MGNAIGPKKTTKVMKITGETFKMRTPVLAGDVLKEHPGHVLLESESVKHFGVRAKPLGADRNLEPRRLYFLVELPTSYRLGNELADGRVPRRVRSGITMGAKDRLESLMLARRSVSDLSIVTAATTGENSGPAVLEECEGGSSNKRVRMRLPKAEVERLMRSSRDEAEAAEKIVNLYIANRQRNIANTEGEGNVEQQQRGPKIREKRVSFMAPGSGGAVQIAVA